MCLSKETQKEKKNTSWIRMMFCLRWRLEHQRCSVVPVWGHTLTFHWGAFQITTPWPSLPDIAAPQPKNLQLLGISY